MNLNSHGRRKIRKVLSTTKGEIEYENCIEAPNVNVQKEKDSQT